MVVRSSLHRTKYSRGRPNAKKPDVQRELPPELRTQQLLTFDQANNDLRATTPILPAMRNLGDGRSSFFNQLIAAFKGWKDTRNDPSKAITFGDGTSINPEDVEIASTLAEDCTFDLPWHSGDLALVDNYTAMHGRRTFTGTRRVLASLVAS